jgi:hypothetical protein
VPKGGREIDEYQRFRTHPSTDGAIVDVAAGQHAVIDLTQLYELDIGEGAIYYRVAARRLHRIHRTVYSIVPKRLLTREGHWMAAVLACGPGVVLSHRTAAALHGLLSAADVTVVNGIPCTTMARTLFDLAEVVSRRPLERAFDQWDIMGEFDLRAIQDQLVRNPTRPAARRVQQLLDEHYIGSTPTQNELEEAFFALSRSAGVPDPRVSEWVDLEDGGPMIWADFVWRRQRVIVETDGRRVHGTHQARQRDPRRDQRAIVAGWRPIRTTWRQVMFRPHELRLTIAKLVNG